MPYADGIFPAWRKETNYFINAKPQMGSLNVGAWRILELSIRKEAIALMQTLEVYTGAFDLIRHLNEDLQVIEVHKFWYKIVKGTDRWIDMRGNAGIVFVACNDADSSCNVELANICQNICKATGWLVTAPTAKEKIICCSLDDFYKSGKVAKIPETEGITKIMGSLQSGALGA